MSTQHQYTLQPRQLTLNETYDVIVVGGGPAGCTAAIAAARNGSKTLLLEAAYALGGMGTLGLVPWFCGYGDGEKIIARGLAEQVLNRCIEQTPHLKSVNQAPAIDSELLKRIYDRMVTDAGVDILFGSQVCGVEMRDARQVDTLIVSNKAGLTAYRAKVYVDCTGDGDLAAWAGAAFEKGDADGGMQPATLCFVITNIDEEALARGPSIHFYDANSPIYPAIQSDNYPLVKDLHTCFIKIGPKAYGFNTSHIYDVDNTDPENVSRAMVYGREMVSQYHQAFADLHPAFCHSFLAATGSLMGIRETRRITGDYVLSVDDYLNKRSFPDEICRNAYGIDVHGSKKQERCYTDFKDIPAFIEKCKKRNESITKPLQPGESVGVPYRCLTPKGLDNLLVAGRCISADRQANGSVRIMACCLNTGEAAGAAAAMTVSGSGNVHEVDTDKLRAELIQNGAYLPS